jgi:hypothetical protein
LAGRDFYHGLWTKALEAHPLEFALIVAGIVVGLIGSSVLQERIHDRARLAWHKNFREDYAGWLIESQKGWRNGMLLLLFVAIVGLVLVLWFGADALIGLELGTLIFVVLAVLALHRVGTRQVAQSETAPIRGTFALSVARFLRNNSILRSLHKWIFERAVPIAFALLLVVAGYFAFNRTLFDGVSAAGYFCKSSPDATARKAEKTESKEGFTTDQMCWPS